MPAELWLSPVPRLVRGVCDVRRSAAATADPQLACCLLWLAAPALRRSWNEDTLAALLRFCDAALSRSHAEEPSEDAVPADSGRELTAATEVTPQPQPETGDNSVEDEAAEARAELAARLDATAAFLARHCGGGAARFVGCPGRRWEAALLLAAVARTEPELARRLRLPLPADRDTHRL